MQQWWQKRASVLLYTSKYTSVLLNTENIKPYKFILIVTEDSISTKLISFSFNPMVLQTSMALVQTSTYTNQVYYPKHNRRPY